MGGRENVIDHMRVKDLIQQARAELNDPDPGHIADAVMEMIDKTDYEAALHQTLRDYVRVYVRSVRHPGHNRPDPAANSANSSKQAKLREWGKQWSERELYTEVHVGGEGWKFLGDCTASDLEFAEQERYAIADATRERGRWFGKVRAALDEHEVETVAELPEGVMKDLFN